MSKGDWAYLGKGLLFLVFAIAALTGMMLIGKSMQDDAAACERAGGVIVQMTKCVQRVELHPL